MVKVLSKKLEKIPTLVLFNHTIINDKENTKFLDFLVV